MSDEKKQNKSIDPAMAALVLIARKENRGQRGVSGEVECPSCKGVVKYSIETSNGHIQARCMIGCFEIKGNENKESK